MLTRKLSFPYIVTAQPVTQPISLSDVKDHLRLDKSESYDDNYLESLMESATLYCQNYTSRLLTRQTVETYRDNFGDSLTVRKSPVQSITKIEYLSEGIWETVDTSVYYLTVSSGFPEICLNTDKAWPVSIDTREQAIKITILCGYGVTGESVPESLKTGLLQHIAFLFENKGDSDVSESLPLTSKMIYDQYKITTL